MAKYLVLIMLLLWVVLALQSTVVVVGDYASDQAECSKSMVGLATCLPYVQGAAKMPTPDCCTGLKEVLSKTRKCLCVLIKDRNDPNLGIKINVSLAIMLPDACKAPANFTKCPELLKLPPNSPDAQIFKQPDKALQGNSTTAKGNSASAPESSKVGSNHLGRREWLKVEMVSGLLFLLVMPFLGY